jgi:hypothetical protein
LSSATNRHPGSTNSTMSGLDVTVSNDGSST